MNAGLGDGYPLLVSAAIVRSGPHVLIARRTSGDLAGLWEFPGGKIEPWEHPEDSLMREIREELALDVRVDDIFAVVYHVYPSGPVLLLAYLCSPVAQDSPGPAPEEPRSGTAGDVGDAPWRWVTVQELQHYDFAPADKKIVEKILASGFGR